MSSLSLFFFLFLVSIYLISSTTAQSWICSDTVGNFTKNSAYQLQLDSIISSIASTNSTKYGFFSASSQSSDTPNVMGLCRVDQRTEVCRACLNASAYVLRLVCPDQKEAVMYYENCTLRYSNGSLLGKVVTSPNVILSATENVTVTFNRALTQLLKNLRNEAASSGSLRKFASGDIIGNDVYTLYGYVQCTPDLSEEQCSDCLLDTVSILNQTTSGKPAGGIVSPSCSVRFRSSPFLDPVEPLPVTPTTPSPPLDNKSKTRRTIILIVVPIIAAVIIIIIFFIFFLKIKMKKRSSPYQTISELRDVEYVQYDLSTIEVATNNFSEDNKLGQGGFGAVYKGKLPNGQVIAVKRLSRGSRQGELEFKNEVILLVKLQHRNLVRLQGFSLEGNEKLLIYEFLENSSLDHFIFNPNKCELLDWDTRYKIIIGIARGLLYLHEDSRLRIIHRDLKASNILLDAEMNPKISDFGLAKLFLLDQTQANTNRIVGTYGYMAPEYAMHGKFSIKSDVYSFGVLVLEIVSGEKNNCFLNGEYVKDLPNFVWRNWIEGTLSKVIDPTLKSVSRAEMERCLHIGLLCVQQNVAVRPAMASVVHMLNSDSTTLALPSQPACFMQDDTVIDMFSMKGSRVDQSKANVSITELYPR